MTQFLSVLTVAVLIDYLIGEPPDRLHPVCWMGKTINFFWTRRPSKGLFIFGLVLVLSGAAFFALLGAFISRLWWPLSFVLSVWFLKGTMSARALAEAGMEVRCALASGDLPLARERLAWHLVSRDTSSLSGSEVAGAGIESMSENLSDGWVGPILAYGLFGLSGAMAYRFVNTCDSMLGYRFGDFEMGGKTSALLDDLFNIVPSRASSILLILAAWISGLDWRRGLTATLGLHGVTESPNAGWPMATMAGILGVTLTKRECYSIPGGPKEPGVKDLSVSIGVLSKAQFLAIPLGILAGVL